MKKVIEDSSIIMIDPFTQSYVNGVVQMINDIYSSQYGKMAIYANGFRRKNMLAFILEIGSKNLNSTDQTSVMKYVKELNSRNIDSNAVRSLLSTKIGTDTKGMKSLLETLSDSGAYEWMDNILGGSQSLMNDSLTDICISVTSNLRNSDIAPDLKKAYATRLVLEILALIQLHDSKLDTPDVVKISSTAALQHRVTSIGELVDMRVKRDIADGVIEIEMNKLEDLIRDRTVYHLINTSMNETDVMMSSAATHFYKDVFSNDYVIDFILDLIGNLL